MKAVWIMALCAPMGLGACARQSRCAAPQQLAVTRTVTQTETKKGPSQAEKAMQLTSLEFSEEIARICKLPDAHFPFDSAEIVGEVQGALDKLAACVTQGELSGRHLKVVGHADPRGTEEYNLGLGQRRAGSVANYLMAKGIPNDKIESVSVGEYQATGTDEAGWAHDRRVEILLGDEAIFMPKASEPGGGGI